jgi:hypothetical protein
MLNERNSPFVLTFNLALKDKADNCRESNLKEAIGIEE